MSASPGASVLEPGARLGAYVIDEVAEAGAFTVTYRAREALLGREVSIRALKTTVAATSPYASAIEREARALAAIAHAGVPKLLAFDRTGDALYLVVAATKGPTLDKVIEAGRIEALGALAIAIGVAEAIAAAHAAGVVHRDLRPRHVVVGRAAIVVDGFDHAITLEHAAAPEVVHADALEPHTFLAPEIAAGDRGDARSDVFAIGALLFAMIAGEPPPRRAPPLATKSPDVPRSIERIVARCLAEDPRERFDDAGALANALGLALTEATTAPARALVVRALVTAKLDEGAALPAIELPRRPKRDGDPSLREAAKSLAIVLALIVVGGVAIESMRGDSSDALPARAESPNERGFLRVVARPWAEVFVDGDHLETTPFARPIPLAPGKHFVTLKHPRAPEEQRPITLAVGQSVLLDVTMQVDRGAPDAGPPDAGDDTP